MSGVSWKAIEGNWCLFLFSDSKAGTSPKNKFPDLAETSQISMIPGRPLMPEAGTEHAASMPCRSISPLGRSSPVFPRSMQRGHTHDGPGMAGDKRVMSPKGYKMMPSVLNARGKTRKIKSVSEVFIFQHKITICLSWSPPPRVQTCRFTNLFTADYTMKLGKLSKYLRAVGESTCNVAPCSMSSGPGSKSGWGILIVLLQDFHA